MAIKSCLMRSDAALTEAAVKKNKPVSADAQKLVEKQEKMFYDLKNDAEFQKSLSGLTKTETTNAYLSKIKGNGVNITRTKTKQMVKNGVTIAKPQPIVMPKPPKVAPGVPKPPPVIPKPPPKIVSVPKEPVPKIIPTEPVPLPKVLKLTSKQEEMFYDIQKDADFQKSLAGLKEKDKAKAITRKYAQSGVYIDKGDVDKMVKGITAPPIPVPKIVVPIKPVPKVIVPIKPVPKVVVPIKPISKVIPTEFKEAKTLKEAVEEFNKYGSGNPMEGRFTKDWSEKKKLEAMNRMNAQMNDMGRWTRGRKIGSVDFDDGDQQWNGKSTQNTSMGFNKITLNHRNSFKKYGYGEKSAGALKKSWFNVSEGNASITLRHEMGHALWFDSAEAKLRIEFTNRYRDLKKILVEENISKYAAKNAKEFFAESFAKYSSPRFKAGSLNKAFGGGFEELMEKILIGGG